MGFFVGQVFGVSIEVEKGKKVLRRGHRDKTVIFLNVKGESELGRGDLTVLVNVDVLPEGFKLLLKGLINLCLVEEDESLSGLLLAQQTVAIDVTDVNDLFGSHWALRNLEVFLEVLLGALDLDCLSGSEDGSESEGFVGHFLLVDCCDY